MSENAQVTLARKNGTYLQTVRATQIVHEDEILGLEQYATNTSFDRWFRDCRALAS